MNSIIKQKPAPSPPGKLVIGMTRTGVHNNAIMTLNHEEKLKLMGHLNWDYLDSHEDMLAVIEGRLESSGAFNQDKLFVRSAYKMGECVMKFEIFLPDNSHKNFTEHDVKVVVASALYDKGICALGYAAESVGFDKRTLIEDMGKFDVPVLKMSRDDVKKVIENAKRSTKKRL